MQTPPQAPESAPPPNPLPTQSFFFGRRSGAPLTIRTGSDRAGTDRAGTGEEVRITPQSLVLLIHAGVWGYVWNWPLAVSVQRGGQVERKAVVDVTRLALWALGLSAALLSLLWLRRSGRT